MSIKFLINSIKLLLATFYLVVSSLIFHYIKILKSLEYSVNLEDLKSVNILGVTLSPSDFNIPKKIDIISLKDYHSYIFTIALTNLIISCLVFSITILGIYDENKSYLQFKKRLKLPF